MGLDFSINFVARKRGTKTVNDFSMCYWRKCYGLARTILEKISPYVLSHDGEWSYLCTVDVIPELISTFCDIIKDRNSMELSDSTWDIDQTRQMIVRSVAALTQFEGLLELLMCKPDKDDVDEYIEQIICGEDFYADAFSDPEILNVFYNPESYDFFIEVVNSY